MPIMSIFFMHDTPLASPLPLWERSDRIADAIRVRGYGLSIDLNPSPRPSPTRGEGRTSIAVADQCNLIVLHLACPTVTKSGNLSFPSATAFGQTTICLPFCHW